MSPVHPHTRTSTVPRSRAQRRNDGVVAAYIHDLATSAGRKHRPLTSRPRARRRGLVQDYLAARCPEARAAGQSPSTGGASR